MVQGAQVSDDSLPCSRGSRAIQDPNWISGGTPGFINDAPPLYSKSHGSSSVHQLRLNSVEGDVGGAAPGVDPCLVEGRCQGRVALENDLHCLLNLFGFCQSFGAAVHDDAFPVGSIGDLFDLETNLRVGFEKLRLHSFGREEVQRSALVRVIHGHHVWPSVTRATEMSEAAAQQQGSHFFRRHVLNFHHFILLKILRDRQECLSYSFRILGNEYSKLTNNPTNE